MYSAAPQPVPRIRVMQRLTLAMAAGVVMFAAVAVLVVGALNEPADGQLISLIGLAVAGLLFVLHLFLPDMVATQNVVAGGQTDWYAVLQVRTIIGLALLEGAAFFNLLACILEHHWWSLAMAGGFVFWMLVGFPTTSRVEQWIATQRLKQDAQ